jgi:hypothetical protein
MAKTPKKPGEWYLIKITAEDETVYFAGFEGMIMKSSKTADRALGIRAKDLEITKGQVDKSLEFYRVEAKVEVVGLDEEMEKEGTPRCPLTLGANLKEDLETLEPMLRQAGDDELEVAIRELKELREEFSRLTTKLTDLLAIATEEKMKREFNRAGKKDDKSGATQRVRINKKGK